jgi:CRP-like cAMP-binding protein
MENITIAKMLQSCLLFKNTTEPAILNFINDFPCQIQEYNHGDCIISKDETAGYIGIVLCGTLGIYSDSFFGGHTLIGIADKEYLFGFIAHFYNNARSITALYARNRCRIAKFMIPPRMTGHEFITKTDTRIVSNIFAILTAHIEHDFNRMYFISTYSVEVKLARYLIYEHSQHGGPAFECAFNRTELANFLGVYRTSLIHEIKKMCDEGLISVDKKQFRILDLQRLIDIELMSYDK